MRNNNKNWRNSYNYVNSYNPPKRRRTMRKFIKCEKYIATHIDTGERTCAILYINSGRVKVGPDVWRLSNPADCCDYPLLVFPTIDAAKRYFNFEEAPHSYLYNPEREEVS